LRREALLRIPVSLRVLTAVAVTVVGCASGGKNATQTLLVAAVNKSEAASTFHFSGRAFIDQPGQAPSQERLTGDSDHRSHRTEITTAESSATSASKTAPLTNLPPAPPVEAGSMTEIIIGNDVWVTGARLLLTQRGEWLHLATPMAIPLLPFFASSSDPVQFFEIIRSQLKEFRDLGVATIDGTLTHHYQGIRSAPELNGTGIPIRFSDAEVWVDPSGLVRQLMSTVTTGAASFGDHHELSDLTVTVTIDFTGYGTPVNFQPPPPDKVVQEPAASPQP
jgi:hypothetical protein